eukprot:356963-Chlamydomonas_euryale.AAC.5
MAGERRGNDGVMKGVRLDSTHAYQHACGDSRIPPCMLACMRLAKALAPAGGLPRVSPPSRRSATYCATDIAASVGVARACSLVLTLAHSCSLALTLAHFAAAVAAAAVLWDPAWRAHKRRRDCMVGFEDSVCTCGSMSAWLAPRMECAHAAA